MSPLPLLVPSFLQGSLKSYSTVRRWGGDAPPPPFSREAAFDASVAQLSVCEYPPTDLPLSGIAEEGVLRWVDLVEGGPYP